MFAVFPSDSVDGGGSAVGPFAAPVSLPTLSGSSRSARFVKASRTSRCPMVVTLNLFLSIGALGSSCIA